MTNNQQKELGKILWAIADQLRGAMNADDFRDYMLSFLFLRYLSDNYEAAAKKELGSEYPSENGLENGDKTPLQIWYKENEKDKKPKNDKSGKAHKKDPAPTPLTPAPSKGKTGKQDVYGSDLSERSARFPQNQKL